MALPSFSNSSAELAELKELLDSAPLTDKGHVQPEVPARLRFCGCGMAPPKWMLASFKRTTKAEVRDAFFKKIRQSMANRICFDCPARNPVWLSLPSPETACESI